MPEETNSATLAPPVDDSYEAWEQTQQKAPPAQEPKATEKTKPSVPEPEDDQIAVLGRHGKGQTAAVPETAQPQEQKQQSRQVERKRDAESTIHKKDREIAELRKQLEDTRKNAATPQESRPAPEVSRPASQPTANLSDLDEYVKAEHLKRPDVLQERLIQEWIGQEFGRREKQARIDRAMQDFRTKHPDVADDVFNLRIGDPQGQMLRAMADNFQNWPEVLHYLQQNPDEYRQLVALSPNEQWFDVVAIARQLKRGTLSVSPAEQPAAQEQPRNVRPISRIPAPQKHLLGGGMSSSGKDPKDARDFEEYEPLERKRLSGGR